MEPIGGVRPMAGLLNRLRRFTDDDGAPTVLGFHAIGDCHTTTNPLYGRGCSLAAVQATLLADATAAHPGDPAARAAAYEAACAREIEPWYEASVQMDKHGRRPVRPARRSAVAATGPTARPPRRMGALFAAAATDPILGRAMARLMNLLTLPEDLMADPAVLARAMEVMADPDAYPVPVTEGPTRDRAARVARQPSPPPEPPARHQEPPLPADPSITVAHGRHQRRRAPRRRGRRRASPSCSPTASPSWRTRGATRSRRSPPPATTRIAPDQRGYGRSSRPEAIEDYDIVHLTDDLLGLLDDIGRGAGGVRRPRLGLDGRVADGAAAPRAGGRRVSA